MAVKRALEGDMFVSRVAPKTKCYDNSGYFLYCLLQTHNAFCLCIQTGGSLIPITVSKAVYW